MTEYYQHKETKLIYWISGARGSLERQYVGVFLTPIVSVGMSNMFVNMEYFDKKFIQIRIICKLKKIKYFYQYISTGKIYNNRMGVNPSLFHKIRITCKLKKK